jgi:hypothetical protein
VQCATRIEQVYFIGCGASKPDFLLVSRKGVNAWSVGNIVVDLFFEQGFSF